MRRMCIGIVASALLAVTAARADIATAARHGSPARPRGTTATAVAGGMTTVPTGIPTGGNAKTLTFQGYSTEEWTGSWSGVSMAEITWAHVDPSTGAVTGTIIDKFTGLYAADHSQGNLTFAETFRGNLLTGSGVLEGDIIASSGDPTFRCSSGHLTMPFYFNAVAGFGGYSGTWHHRCH